MHKGDNFWILTYLADLFPFVGVHNYRVLRVNFSFISDPIFFKLSQILDYDMQFCTRGIILGFGFLSEFLPFVDFQRKFYAFNCWSVSKFLCG